MKTVPEANDVKKIECATGHEMASQIIQELIFSSARNYFFFHFFFAFFFPGSIMFNQNVPRGGGLDGAFDKELDGCSAIMVIGNVQHLQ